MYAAGISSASLFSNECTQVFQPLTATESHYSHVHSFVQPLGPNLYRTVYFPSHFLHISRCIVHFAFFLKKTFVVFRQIRHAVYIPPEKGRKKGIAPVPCSTGAIEGVSLLVWGGIMYRNPDCGFRVSVILIIGRNCVSYLKGLWTICK